MIKRLVSLAFVAISFLSFVPVASAQVHGTCAYVNPGNGRPGFWNCPQQVQQPQQIIIRDVSQIGGNPIYANGGGMPSGGFSSCSMIGGLAGGTLGSLANNHRGQAVILGALIGGVVGNWACSPAPQQRQQQGQPVVQQVAVQPAAVQTPTSGVFCNIDGNVTKEDSAATCEAKAKAKAETLVSGTNVAVKSQEKEPVCASNKRWTKLNWPGHPQHETFVCLPEGDPHRF